MSSIANPSETTRRQEKKLSCLDTPDSYASESNPTEGKPRHSELAFAENRSPRIAILVDTSSEWGRQLVQGINSYAIKHGPWKLCIETRSLFRQSARDVHNLLAHWKADGVITPIANNLIAKTLSEYGKPAVNVSAVALKSFKVPQVTSNVNAVAAMALEHFSYRGVRNLAYLGPLQNPGVQCHAAAFREAVEKSGCQFQTFDCVEEAALMKGWNDRRASLSAWLQLLPKPVGIFSWRTGGAIEVLDICSTIGISVPDDISVLAGEDDSLLCATTTPTLSGVDTASEQIGFAAARQLDQLLQGQSNFEQQGCEFVDPVMVTLRQSTDSLAITDPDLLAAVRYIRMNACRGITVQRVADSVPIGRRSMERKFKECFGRTPLEEIQRLRLSRVRELLVKTDLAIAKIARDTGFGTPEYMTTMFKCRFGLTPLKFRSQSRTR